jgi:hypothetical protein
MRRRLATALILVAALVVLVPSQAPGSLVTLVSSRLGLGPAASERLGGVVADKLSPVHDGAIEGLRGVSAAVLHHYADNWKTNLEAALVETVAIVLLFWWLLFGAASGS